MEQIVGTNTRPDKVPDQQANDATEAALAAIKEVLFAQRALSELGAGLKGPSAGAPENASSQRQVPSSEAVEGDISNTDARLEQDFFDDAVHAAVSSTESAERELASTEIVLRLERDLRELIARSAHAEIGTVSRAVVMAQKTLAAQAHAFRVPVAEPYFPRDLKNDEVEGRRNMRVGELPEEAASALRRSRMDRRHAHLDSLMPE